MSRQVYRNDYRDEDDLQNKMFEKEISSHWRARYPRKIRDANLAWKINILVGLHFLLLFLFCIQLQSIPSMILDSQERILNIVSNANGK